MSEPSDIAILGPGRLGTTLAVLAAKVGRSVTIGARDISLAQDAASRVSSRAQAMPLEQAAGNAKLALLTVSDDAIEPVCSQLADRGAFAEGAIVAHCSGSLSSEALYAARKCNCSVGSMHPLQTFPSVSQALDRFDGTHCFCEGDEPALSALETLAKELGGIPVRIDAAKKVLYHAGAVMACNYFATLIDAALSLEEQAGIDRETAQAALKPLIQATVRNVLSSGPDNALTGPIARGDRQTVQRHLGAMQDTPKGVQDLYRAAGKHTVELALRKGTLTPEAADALRAILDEPKNLEQG